MREAIDRARREGITHIAFGDLFLEDIRAYRERMLAGTGVDPLFPIWTTFSDTGRLAREMIAADLRAVITCVDPKQLDGRFAGREFDEDLLADLPGKVDPCGERGEFHTFCWSGPMFSQPINVRVPGVSFRDGFWFADLVHRDPQTALQTLDAGPRA
jgi:diphthamide synthase (EF-2-diphthine--ammonia ligase)